MKSYADEWFEKHGYKLIQEDRSQVTYGFTGHNIEKRLAIASSCLDIPYFHYGVKAFAYVGDNVQPFTIFNDELEHLQMKAKEMMKKFLEPAIEEEVQKIPHHFPMCK